MQTVILVVHILASIALTAVVLLQRSEGGALGIGGGGPGGGLMSGRGAAGALARTTMIFAAVFFVTSLTLTTIAARSGGGGASVVDDGAPVQDGGSVLDVDPNDLTSPDYNPLDDPALRNPLDDAAQPETPALPLDDAPVSQPEETPAGEVSPTEGPDAGIEGEETEAGEGEPQ